MNALIIIGSVIGWAFWRRSLGGMWSLLSRWPIVTICAIYSGVIGYCVASLYMPLFWAVIIGAVFAALVTIYWVSDHEPEGPTWWSVCRYLGPVGLSWWLARKIWRGWMLCPPAIDCAGTLGEWISGGMFGLFFGLALVALI